MKLKVGDEVAAISMGRFRKIYRVSRVNDRYAFLDGEIFFSLEREYDPAVGVVTTVGSADRTSDYIVVSGKVRKRIENQRIAALIYAQADNIKQLTATELQRSETTINFQEVLDKLVKLQHSIWQ